uniref:Uncharacterized protein n=1 Tax=Oryza glumipatula TaxID=40148 RepID=A0A0E0B9W3_9ORYZ
MEEFGRQPCKREQELGWESFHPSSAHHLFDEMSSPLEVFEEDVLLVMSEENITWDEALHLLQEELKDAQCRFDEKLDRFLEVFGLMGDKSNQSEGDKRSNESEEFSASIKELIPTTEAAAFQSPQASPSSASTKCSMICFGLDTMSDLNMAAAVVCATTSLASVELVAGGNATCEPYVNTPGHPKETHANCSMVGLEVKGDTDHTKVTCHTMMGVPDGVLVPDASSKVFSPWLIAEMDLIPLLPTVCSMKCSKDKKKLLMGNAKRNSWPPSWLGGVISRCELQPLPWPGSKLYWEGLPLTPSWPPPARVSFLACEPFDIGALVIGTVILTQEMAEIKPWPPPSEVSGLPSVIQSIGAFHTERKVTDLHWAELKAWSLFDENGTSHILTDELCELYLDCVIFTAGNTRNLEKLEFIRWTKWQQQLFTERDYPNSAEGNQLIAWNFKQYIDGRVLSFVAINLSIQPTNVEQISQYIVQYSSIERELDFSDKLHTHAQVIGRKDSLLQLSEPQLTSCKVGQNTKKDGWCLIMDKRCSDFFKLLALLDGKLEAIRHAMVYLITKLIHISPRNEPFRSTINYLLGGNNLVLLHKSIVGIHLGWWVFPCHYIGVRPLEIWVRRLAQFWQHKGQAKPSLAFLHSNPTTSLVRILHKPWDPGGGINFILFHFYRLEGKPNFKERGLLGT